MTAYNWETNASNAGSDWHNQNDDCWAAALRRTGPWGRHVAARNAGAGIVVTVPIIGRVAADKNGGGDVNQTPNYLAARFKREPAAQGRAVHLTPDTADAFVNQDEYIHFLDQDLSRRVCLDHTDHGQPRQRGGPLGITRTRVCAVMPDPLLPRRATRSPMPKSCSSGSITPARRKT